MALLQRLRNRITQRAEPALPHVDPELEARLPGDLQGLPLDRLSHGFEGLDEYGQWWFTPFLDGLGLETSAFTVAFAGRTDDSRGIRAARFRGARPRNLQELADLDAATDRQLTRGHEVVTLGGVGLRRGVAGERSFTVADDGSLVADGQPDAASVTHDVVRGDTWFHLFAHGDDAWLAAAAVAIAGPRPDGPRDVRITLPEGWVSSRLPDGADAALAERLEVAIAEAAEPGRAAWMQLAEALRPANFQRPFVSGTRLVAFDLERARRGETPTSIEVWEHLPPFDLLEDELRRESRYFSSVADVETRWTDLPSGRAGVVRAVVRGEEPPLRLEEWFIRTESDAYQLLSRGPADDPRLPGEVESIVSSFTVVG